MTKRSFLPSLWGRSDDGDDMFGSLHREVERVFDDFNRGFRLPARTGGMSFGETRLSPRIDMTETDDAIEITVELPGVAEKDVDVTLADDVLTIKGEKKSEKEEKEKDYHLVERTFGSFQRSLRLPYGSDPDKVDAKFEDGVLKVVLPKPPEMETKTQKIEIKSAA